MPQSTYSIATLSAFAGCELGTSPWLEVTQDMVDEFAECTGDRQWIHVDVERARRESPYGGTVAHGYLTLSLLARFSMEIGAVPGDAKAAFNYGLDKVRFIAPVRVGSRIRGRLAIAEVTDQGKGRWLVKLTNTVEIEGEGKPALVADSLAVFAE
jgi:acyl dehydratase